MTIEILDWFKNIRKLVSIQAGRVLEVGSQDINGSARQFFPDAKEYIGIDMQEGKGVDLVLDASKILDHFGSESFDTVVCCEMLEHDLYFMNTLVNMKLVLKPQGWLFLTTPTFGFPLHRYPKDYWRFGEDAYKECLLKGFEIIDLEFTDDHLSGNKDCEIVSLSIKQ